MFLNALTVEYCIFFNSKCIMNKHNILINFLTKYLFAIAKHVLKISNPYSPSHASEDTIINGFFAFDKSPEISDFAFDIFIKLV